MADPWSDELAVLHALRVKGFATVDTIGRFVGPSLATATIDEQLARLADARLARFRGGRLEAWALTETGRAVHDGRLAAEHGDVTPLREVHRRFVAVNPSFKQLCTDWQLGGRTPAAERRLDAIHTDALSMVEAAAVTRGRFAPYGLRFTDARRRVVAGDDAALTRPLAESYHDIWMELHQDLLLTLGLERSTADGW